MSVSVATPGRRRDASPRQQRSGRPPDAIKKGHPMRKDIPEDIGCVPLKIDDRPWFTQRSDVPEDVGRDI